MLGTKISISPASVPFDLYSSVATVIVSVPQKTEARGCQVTLLRSEDWKSGWDRNQRGHGSPTLECLLSAWSALLGVGLTFWAGINAT